MRCKRCPSLAKTVGPCPIDRVCGLRRMLRPQGGLGVGDSEFSGPLVCKGEEASNPSGNGVLGHGGIGERTELLQARLAVLQSQPPCLDQVVWNLVSQDFHGSLYSCPSCDGSPR